MMTGITEEERQIIVKLISTRLAMLSGRSAAPELRELTVLLRKISGTDKRLMVHG